MSALSDLFFNLNVLTINSALIFKINKGNACVNRLADYPPKNHKKYRKFYKKKKINQTVELIIGINKITSNEVNVIASTSSYSSSNY